VPGRDVHIPDLQLNDLDRADQLDQVPDRDPVAG
jgi:hypothetical protein